MPLPRRAEIIALIIENQAISQVNAKRAQMFTAITRSKTAAPYYIEWARTRAIQAQQSAADAHERIAFLRDL